MVSYSLQLKFNLFTLVSDSYYTKAGTRFYINPNILNSSNYFNEQLLLKLFSININTKLIIVYFITPLLSHCSCILEYSKSLPN
jgi:hypothetical protein